MALPRRIWFVNRFFAPDHSATSQIVSDLAFHLAAKGHAVSILTSRGLYDQPDAVLPAFEQVDGVHVHRVARTRYGRGNLGQRALDVLRLYSSFALALWRLAARGDIVVVKTDPPMLSIALAPVAQLKGLWLVNWLQDLYPEVAIHLGVSAIRPFGPLLSALRNQSLRVAAINVVIGERMSKLLQAYGLPASRIVTIANWGQDQSVQPVAADNNPLRTTWGLEGKFVIGYSGNLGRAHEYETLLQAAQRLRSQCDLIFLFIGGGHLTSRLKDDVKRLELEHLFQFRPYQDAALLGQSLSLPDIHWVSLLPDMEGLIVPSKFYGIAAAGRPTLTISDPEGEIASLVTRFDCGVCVAPGEGVKLATLIEGLKRNPQRLAEMGANARAMLEANYSRQIALSRWDDLLASLP